MATVLVIDDDDLLRATMRRILAGAGHTVMEAVDGVHGLASAMARCPDVVVCDVIMPNKEGIETIAALRRQYDRLPILAISGGGRVGTSDFLRMSVDFGANDILPKPFLPAQLIEAIGRLLAPRENTYSPAQP